MDVITIEDLAVLCRIGVPDEERAKSQRLLVTVRMSGDFSQAAQTDDIAHTINYFDVSRQIVEFCQNNSCKLIEKLAHDIAQFVLRDFGAVSATVQVKKFILPDARYVAFELTSSRL